MMQALQKGFQVTSESEALIIRKITLKPALARKWQTKGAKDLFLPQISTKAQIKPLFCPLESGYGREDVCTAGRDGVQESRTNNKQTTKYAENKHQRAP